jgi:hypothetical protein
MNQLASNLKERAVAEPSPLGKGDREAVDEVADALMTDNIPYKKNLA